MTRQLIDEVMAEAHGRMLGDGIWYPDLREILERVRHWDQWYDVWAEFGGGTGGSQTSLKAAPLLAPPAERVEVPIDDTSIPCYLRLPPGVAKAPCAILIGGLESTKEESYGFENLLLRRGVATLAFDGPGQGEMRFRGKMQPDFERYAGRVIDFLEGRAEIDPSRIGVLGRSLGGYYAARSAAFDRRLKCCVCWGCIFRIADFWNRIHVATQDGLAYVCGAASHAEAEERGSRTG